MKNKYAIIALSTLAFVIVVGALVKYAEACTPANITQDNVIVETKGQQGDTYISGGWAKFLWYQCSNPGYKMRWRGWSNMHWSCTPTGVDGLEQWCTFCFFAEAYSGTGFTTKVWEMQPQTTAQPTNCNESLNGTINAILPTSGECCSVVSGTAYRMMFGYADRNRSASPDNCMAQGGYPPGQAKYVDTTAPSCN